MPRKTIEPTFVNADDAELFRKTTKAVMWTALQELVIATHAGDYSNAMKGCLSDAERYLKFVAVMEDAKVEKRSKK